MVRIENDQCIVVEIVREDGGDKTVVRGVGVTGVVEIVVGQCADVGKGEMGEVSGF